MASFRSEAEAFSGMSGMAEGHDRYARGLKPRALDRGVGSFIYQGKMELEIAKVKTGFNLRTEVDTSEIKKGTVTIRIYTPLAGLLPKPLVDKIEIKIQSLTGEAVQKKMLAYFDDLEKRRPQGSGIAGTLELILIQGYNTGSSARLGEGREPGDAEPLSDQILFLATLAIWFIVVPLVALLIYLWRKSKRRRLEARRADG